MYIHQIRLAMGPIGTLNQIGQFKNEAVKFNNSIHNLVRQTMEFYTLTTLGKWHHLFLRAIVFRVKIKVGSHVCPSKQLEVCDNMYLHAYKLLRRKIKGVSHSYLPKYLQVSDNMFYMYTKVCLTKLRA